MMAAVLSPDVVDGSCVEAGRAGGRKRRTQPISAHVDNHQFMSSDIWPVGSGVKLTLLGGGGSCT